MTTVSPMRGWVREMSVAKVPCAATSWATPSSTSASLTRGRLTGPSGKGADEAISPTGIGNTEALMPPSPTERTLGTKSGSTPSASSASSTSGSASDGAASLPSPAPAREMSQVSKPSPAFVRTTCVTPMQSP